MLRHTLVGLCAAVALVQPTAAQSVPVDDYVWAAACKGCHSAQYSAWATTKHARALARLSAAERAPDGGCVACHVTGAPSLAPDEANANVQCEACHGPGRGHMQGDPRAITRKPDEKICVACHSEKSPRFKFFSYSALAPLVHKTVK